MEGYLVRGGALYFGTQAGCVQKTCRGTSYGKMQFISNVAFKKKNKHTFIELR